MIAPLQPPDSVHLEAARGWLELGNEQEATEELDQITLDCRVHPDVLELRWKIYAKTQRWDECLRVSEALIQLAPERVSGWLTKSIALHGLNRIQEAFDALLPAAEKFPHVSGIAYDLACYACRLGRLPEARNWLSKALSGEDSERWRLMARSDPDLKPLWKEMQSF